MTQEKDYIVRCVSCRTKNRIPADKAGLTAKCGKCKSSIETQELFIGKPLILNDTDFTANVLLSPLPVLVDCWATWCGPCQMIGPIVEHLASEWKGRIRVCKLNVDENPATSAQYSIMSVPTLLIFDNGELKDSLAGAMPKHQIVRKMAAYLG